MALAPHEQRALLWMERSLAKNPAVRSALSAHKHGCCSRPRTTPERTSAWHPILWRTGSVVMVGLTLAFVAVSILLLTRA